METIIQNDRTLRASITDLAEINHLLKTEDLPEVGAREFTNHFYKSVNPENKITGAIGLEIYGHYGLLRSLVVDPRYRNNGLANQLVAQIMKSAAELGLKEVYLLTSTADKYFLKKGFEVRNRQDCPVEIRESREYSSICPVSSALMSRKV